MKTPFEDVLLTAYLDNELTELERRTVEEQLVLSEESRNLLAELASIRDRVKLLHTVKSERSFRAGPWSQSSLTQAEATDRLHPTSSVLESSGNAWNWTWQQLVSIAALLAIAACSSLLWMRSNESASSIAFDSSAARDKAVEDKPKKAEETNVEITNAVNDELNRLLNTVQQNRYLRQQVPTKKSENSLQMTLKEAEELPQVLNGFVRAELNPSEPSNPSEPPEPSEIGTEVSAISAEIPAKVIYRFLASDQLRSSIASKGASVPEKQNRLRSVVGSVVDSVVDSVVEFQIPTERWMEGATRLRQMGLDLPDQPPPKPIEMSFGMEAGSQWFSYKPKDSSQSPIQQAVRLRIRALERQQSKP